MPANRHRAASRKPGRPAAEVLEARQLLATIIVNNVGYANGTEPTDSLSLRQAIEISNGTLPLSALTPAQAGQVVGGLASPNTIDFAIPGGAGPFFIRPTSSLPAITKPVLIDGYSQPGAHPNTNGPGLADNASLVIGLDGEGLDLQSSGVTVQGLSISGVRGTGFGEGQGILVEAPGGDLIRGNFLGTETRGLFALGEADGIDVSSSSNTIGGAGVGDGNLISGNGSLLYGPSSSGLSISGTGNLVEGNLIGTDSTGKNPLPNSVDGIIVSGSFNTIGGSVAGAGNLISGNGNDGLLIQSGSNLVEGNLIGTDVAGGGPIPNGFDGVEVSELPANPASANFNTIGGTARGAGNILSGNLANGLAVVASDDLVEGNFIGTDITGTRAIPNGADGVLLGSALLEIFFGGPVNSLRFGDSNTIGGTARGAGNVISGNALAGLATVDLDDLIQGNFLGTDPTGTNPVPNGGDGIDVTGTRDTIGGATLGGGNVIADNRGDGVSVYNGFGGIYVSTDFLPELVGYGRLFAGSGQANPISANSIFGNEGAGIRLLDDAESFLKSVNQPGPPPAATPGDPPGGNGLQAAPAIRSATSVGAGTVVSGTLASTPSTTFTVEVFADPTGSGQGRTYLGSTLATTDALGNASFTFDSTAPLVGQSVTATATDPLGDTSEFASPRIVSAPLPTTTRLVGPSGLSQTGRPVTFTATVSGMTAGAPSGYVAFAEGGVLLALEPVDASGLAIFVTSSLTPGNHVITSAYLGDLADTPSLSGSVNAGVLPTVAFGGPTVTSLASTTLHSVSITFSRPLRVSTARDPKNYAVIGPDGKAVAIKSAVYDPATNSVTLTTRQALKPHQAYRVTVNGHRQGRVADFDGIPLQGKPGSPIGSSFAGTVETGGKAHAKKHPGGPKVAARVR